MKIGLMLLSVFFVSSCMFPTKQLMFDLSDQPMPIMLSGVGSMGQTRLLSFTSGYSSASVTSTRVSGGVSTSSRGHHFQ